MFGRFVLIAVLALGASPAAAQDLVADLSKHLVAITTGFTGTDVLLFGAMDADGEVVVVVTGPQADVTVRRKERVAGIWMNRTSLRFADVPSFYAVAASAPIDEIASDFVLARHRIGVPHLRLTPGLRDRNVTPETMEEFRQALIAVKQDQELYPRRVGQVNILGNRLFRTEMYFPANVPTGSYTIQIFLFRDGQVVNAQTTPLLISKIGFGADVFEFAHGQAAVYGFLAIVFAAVAGWLGGVVFRRA